MGYKKEHEPKAYRNGIGDNKMVRKHIEDKTLSHSLNKERLTKKSITAGENALTDDEVDKLFASLDDMRNVVLLKLAIATGIRRGDIVTIQRQDIEKNRITFYERKKGALHSVPISNEMHNLIQMYIKMSRKSKWLFPSPKMGKFKNKHLHDRQCWDIFNDALKAIGLHQRPFHALRATCIKRAQRKGWTIEQVMKLTNDTFQTIKLHYDTPTKSEMEEAAINNPL